MLLDDATPIFARLKAAFPAMALDEAQADVLLKEMALLHDPAILDEAVTNLIQKEDRFPAIARIRSAYRSVAEARALEQRALRAAESDADNEIPVWVQVWHWRRLQTMTARQAANTTAQGPVDQRPLVKMRAFPQFAHLEPGALAYSQAEYEQLEREWRESGCPSIGSVGELLEGVGA